MEEALKELERFFPGKWQQLDGQFIGPFGLLVFLTYLVEHPTTEQERGEALEPLITALGKLQDTLNRDQRQLLSEAIIKFFALTATLTLPHIKDKEKRLEAFIRSLGAINDSKAAAIARAKSIATELWQADTAQEIRLGDMAERVYRALADEGFAESLPGTAERLKEWIKPAAPDYARKGGRRRKTP